MGWQLRFLVGLDCLFAANALSFQPQVSANQSEVEGEGKRPMWIWQSRWDDWKTAVGANIFDDHYRQLGQYGNRGEGQARVWNALGQNTWMMIIDGCDHKHGPHAFNNTEGSKRNDQDGKLLEHALKAVMQFSSSSAWPSLRWTWDGLLSLNAGLKGASGKFDPMSALRPRCDTEQTGDFAKAWYSPEIAAHMLQCNPDDDTGSPASHAERKALKNWKVVKVREILDRYYKTVDRITQMCKSECVHEALPHLTELYQGLAELHPFTDANSRTRLIVLQTELVRLGGHPVAMAEIGWGQYTTVSLAEAEWQILNGWCNWEYIVKTGKSPFIDPQTARTRTNLVSYDKTELEGKCVALPRDLPHSGLLSHRKNSKIAGACGRGPRYRNYQQ